ncbi:hypothetical protein [Pseudomonas orientalis]|jgi:hypothetical protein|uniref:Uncharacterized protein n=1 Tax=Pseudomonas orientalis TaxID=76758 RepID=A0A4Q7D3L9_9PSED|nr:hypothetical protein [Pseudomonas orientalis]RZI32562.1 hypothetical protein EUX57_06335 [Pseudomonas orientalis]
MKTIITMILLLIVGQASAGEQIISVQHDSTRAVTCFITAQGGISCLPDNQLRSRSTATPSSDAGRAFQASSVPEKVVMPATPLPQKKGFEL